MNKLSWRTAAAMLLIWLSPALLSSAAIAAELRPYSLPSQQRAEPRAEPPVVEQRAARPQVSEAYYQRFEQRVAKLTPAQRAELVRSFAGKRDRAIEAGRTEEARHYLRMVQILKEGK